MPQPVPPNHERHTDAQAIGVNAVKESRSVWSPENLSVKALFIVIIITVVGFVGCRKVKLFSKSQGSRVQATRDRSATHGAQDGSWWVHASTGCTLSAQARGAHVVLTRKAFLGRCWLVANTACGGSC